MPKKYAKMKPKASQGGRKWSQNGCQNHEKIDAKIDAENGSKKHWKNMKNGSAEPRKSMFFNRKKHTFYEIHYFCTLLKKSLKIASKRVPTSMKKPLKKRYEIEVPKSTRKVMKNTEKGSKMEPKRVPKGIKNGAENGTWKRSKFLEKDCPGFAHPETY